MRSYGASHLPPVGSQGAAAPVQKILSGRNLILSWFPPLLIPSEPSVNLLAFLGKFRLVLGEIPLNLYRPGAWRVQEQVLGQGIFNLILEIPANLAGPGAAAPASQNAWQFRDKAQMQPVLLRPRLEPGQLIICNFLQGFPAQ